MSVKSIPDGYRTITPCIVVSNGLEALGFYERAFGAEVVRKLVMGGKLMHAELRIGDSLINVNDPFPDFGTDAPKPDEPLPASLLIYTEDVDALYDRAIAAGAT